MYACVGTYNSWISSCIARGYQASHQTKNNVRPFIIRIYATRIDNRGLIFFHFIFFLYSFCTWETPVCERGEIKEKKKKEFYGNYVGCRESIFQVTPRRSIYLLSRRHRFLVLSPFVWLASFSENDGVHHCEWGIGLGFSELVDIALRIFFFFFSFFITNFGVFVKTHVTKHHSHFFGSFWLVPWLLDVPNLTHAWVTWWLDADERARCWGGASR